MQEPRQTGGAKNPRKTGLSVLFRRVKTAPTPIWRVVLALLLSTLQLRRVALAPLELVYMQSAEVTVPLASKHSVLSNFTLTTLLFVSFIPFTLHSVLLRLR